MSKKINIVGARIRPFMENAYLNGWDVEAVDGFNDYDSAKFGKLLGCGNGNCQSFKILRESPELFSSGPILFCAPIETEIMLLDQLSGSFELLNCSASAMATCRDIAFLQDAIVEGIMLPNCSEGSRQIVKNLFSGGGVGIRESNGKLAKGEYVQDQIEGDSIGATFITAGGKTFLLGISKHIVGDASFAQPGFQYGGLIYPATVNHGVVEILERFGEKVAKGSGIAGLWGADFILGKFGGLWLLEINPRPTASAELIAMNHSLDLIELQQQALSGKLPAEIVRSDSFVGTAVCYAKDDFIFADPQEWFEAGARDIPHEGGKIAKGRPIISLYASGGGEADVYASLVESALRLYGGQVWII